MKMKVARRILGQSISLFSAFAMSLVVGPTSIQAQEVSLVPVSSSGVATISGDTIHLPPGAQRVTFDIRVSGWDPGLTGQTKLGTYQAQIDSAGFASGDTGVLTLPTIDISCTVATDCPGSGSTCTAGVCSDNGAFVVDPTRPDYVFFGLNDVHAVYINYPGPVLGAMLLTAGDSVVDDGTFHYAGTLVLDVPADASGTFTIGFTLDFSQTYFSDQNNFYIPIISLAPAIVVVETSCAGFPVVVDCNANGQADGCDIAIGTSTDLDGNGIPDECELDCNGNGVVDAFDITDGFSADCNANGIPDECDVASGTSSDCDADGIPDECGVDCNSNGVLDVCDIVNGLSADCNANGQLDVCDIAAGISKDTNGNGVPDVCDVKGISLVPVAASGLHGITGDTIQVFGAGQRVTFEVFVSGWDPGLTGQTKLWSYQAQIDSAGFASGDAGVLTLPTIDIPCTVAADCSGFNSTCTAGVCSDNGAFVVDATRPDYVFFGLDNIHAATTINHDLVLGALVLSPSDSVDDDGTFHYAGTLVLDVPVDASGTFTIGFTQDPTRTFFADQNNNVGIPIPSLVPAIVVVETGCAGLPVVVDCNANGLDDECEIADGVSADCNANGVPDACDIASGMSSDCNSDGIPDECGPDCNLNGIADVCDIAAGISKDLNGNGVPDVCDVKGFSLVPVAASGLHGITGDTIQVLGAGQRVTFDIRVSGWDPNLTGQAKLRTYEAQIDSTGFASGDTGVLTLPTIDIPCTVAADCPGYGSTCTAGVCSDNGAFVVDPTRPDYVFFGLDDIHAVNLVDPDPVLGATLLTAGDSVVDDGTSRYAGTMVLDVPANASGTFVIGFKDLTQSFFADQNNIDIPIPSLAPAIVVVRPDCGLGPGTSDCNGNGQADACDILARVSQDADANGIPDECEIAQLAVADGSRFLQIQLPANLAQDAAIVVQCAGGTERFAGFPSGGVNNVALLKDTKAEAAFLPAAGWASPVNLTALSVAPSTDYLMSVELADGTRSASVPVRTAAWGDVTGLVAGSGPDGTVDFRDIEGLVKCFLQDTPAPSVNACDLDPAIPNGVIDFKDISAGVGAFLSRGYPYAVPVDCQGP